MQKVEILPPLGKEIFKGAATIALSRGDGRKQVVIAVEFAIEAPSLDADGGVIVGLHLHERRTRAV
jgi:hypothetical protein